MDQFVTGSCYFDVQFSFMTVVRFPGADGVQQPMVDVSPIPADCFQPFTLTHVFAKYCKFVQCSELRREVMIDDEEDCSDDDEEDSDEEDYFSDDDDGSDGGSSLNLISEKGYICNAQPEDKVGGRMPLWENWVERFALIYMNHIV